MKLDQPFHRLAARFDVQRLREECTAFPASAWANHPNDINGNRSLRLISVNGEENDDVDGIMLPTQHLMRCLYLRQVLASFGVVWSRSRLLKLEPFAGVPQHADINYHWFTRVRIHIPIITNPAVRFFCGDESVHMAAGEAWIFDNWRLHRVENPINAERIHLVADTTGSASFWQFVARSNSAAPQEHRFDANRNPQLLTEQTLLRRVMHPSEVDLLLLDLQAELTAESGAPPGKRIGYVDLLNAFRRDWRQLYLLFGESAAGLTQYTKLRDSLRLESSLRGDGLTLRTNRIAAHTVLEARVLRVLLPINSAPRAQKMVRSPRADALHRPIFIVAAPRSGSTLLFETLASSEQICTVGGEAHWLVEGIDELRPGAPTVESNRLSAEHCTPEVAGRMVTEILAHLVDHKGHPVPADSNLRFLEKTPKNALRVPFFNRLFPDALFIFLWRDPRENLSSIMEAWRSGHWKTYNGLDGFNEPWSLLLPPDWARMRGKSLEEIAAFQWNTTNRILLNDLTALAKERCSVLSYAQLLADPAATIQRICAFSGLEFNGSLAQRATGELPLSRFTQTPPAPEKWRVNAAAISRVLPTVQETWQRLQDWH